MQAAKDEQARLVLLGCGCGSVVYGAVLLKRFLRGWRRPAPAAAAPAGDYDARRDLLAQTCVLATGGAGAALVGARVFLRLAWVPIWVPTLATSSCVLAYLQRNQKALMKEENNSKLAEHAAHIAPLAFFAGWTAGPFAYFFEGFLLKVFAPYSVATMLGFAAAFVAADHPARLLLHAPLASLSFAGGVAYPLVHGAAAMTAVDRADYRVFLAAWGSAGVWMGVYTALCLAFRPPIDVATHALGLMASGPAAAYYFVKRAMKKKARLLQRLQIELREDKHDMRGIHAAWTLSMAGIYYYALFQAREAHALTRA